MNKQEEYDRLVDKVDFLRIKQKEDSMFETEFIVVTEMWQERKYSEVGQLINTEKWDTSRVAEFCAYLNYHLGAKELSVFYKFL